MDGSIGFVLRLRRKKSVLEIGLIYTLESRILFNSSILVERIRFKKKLEYLLERILDGLGVCFGREALKDLSISVNEKLSKIPFDSFS